CETGRTGRTRRSRRTGRAGRTRRSGRSTCVSRPPRLPRPPCPTCPPCPPVLPVQRRIVSTQLLHLGRVVDLDVGLIRVMLGIILLVGRRFLEALERNHFGHDRSGERLGRIQVRQIGNGLLMLLFILVENR